tara:strand:- start:333 stop:452 length:120 start_codon:yes stop_codon:yes gene_type:complete
VVAVLLTKGTEYERTQNIVAQNATNLFLIPQEKKHGYPP